MRGGMQITDVHLAFAGSDGLGLCTAGAQKLGRIQTGLGG